MALSDIVDIIIKAQQLGITAAGFGVPLVLSQDTPISPGSWTTRTRPYGSIADVAADWGPTTDAYAAAAAIFGQNPTIKRIRIGRALTNPVTQQWGVSVALAQVGATYILWVTDPTGKAAATDGQVKASFTLGATAAWVTLYTVTAGQIVTNVAHGGGSYLVTVGGTDSGVGTGPSDVTPGTVTTVGGISYLSLGLTARVEANDPNDAIVYGLSQAIAALTGPSIAATTVTEPFANGIDGPRVLKIVANATTTWFGVEIADPTLLLATQSHAAPAGGGLATDLTAIANETTDWYGLLTLLNSSAYVLAGAAWIESLPKYTKLYIADTSDTTDATTGSGPQRSLEALARAFTGGFFHPRAFEFPAASEMGRFFAINPGGDNWRLKTLPGVTTGWGNGQQYTVAQVANLDSNNANYYYDLAGLSVIGGSGKVASGEYIDVQRGLSWYIAQLGTRLANLLIQSEKIPYTDKGIALIEAQVLAQNSDGIAAGLINPGSPPGIPGPVVSIPLSGAVSSADRAARTLNGVNTIWTLAGAINKLTVNVTALV